MNELQVHTVASRREWREFVELPYRMRRGDPQFVPMLRADLKKLLDRERHPFWREARGEFFLARRGRAIMGRIAAVDCPAHAELHRERVGFFGFLECEDDREVCARLLQAAETWHHAGGLPRLRGPVSPSTNYECGLLVDGFDQASSIMMPSNPPYVPALLEACGYRKAMDLLAYRLRRDDLLRLGDMVAMRDKLLQRSPVSLRPLDMKQFDAEVERLRHIYNDAWHDNWGFVPMGKDEFRIEAESLKILAEPGLLMIAELDGEPVAFIAAFRDITPALKSMRGRLFSPGFFKLLWQSRHARHVRVAIAGVVRQHRRSGIMALLYLSVMECAFERGILSSELSWILETNTLMRRVVESFGARVSRVFRMYEKDLL
jgi:GNAT superfamily N-acetyltransferase